VEARFQLVEEPTGTWAVFDNLRGLPATKDGRFMIGMRKEDAEAAIAHAAIDTSVAPLPPPRRH